MKRIFFVVLLLTAATVQGQATRTWVSGVGDDANPCSRTAPCKTFAGTISKTATNGEINLVDHGSVGTVVITKSITIDGGGSKAALGFSLVTGMSITGDDVNVVVRNIDFDGLGSGVRAVSITNAASVTIENCTFNNYTTEGIRDTRASGTLRVRNSTFVGGQYGVILSASGVEAVLEDVSISNASIAGARASGSSGQLHIIDSTLSANTSGLIVDNAEAFVERSSFTFNDTGITASTNGTIRLSESVITKNGTGMVILGAVESFGNNRITANTGGNGAGMIAVLQQ